MRLSVPSFAKINLDLRVLHKRADGYHELRTIFQTISLRDTLVIDFEAARKTRIELESSVDIPDNLVLRAASELLDTTGARGHVRLKLSKKIPMGAGLGGGSSNAAATLLALSALVAHAKRRTAELEMVLQIAEKLGSDVPFFLYGGTALGLGRGTELYPLPDQPARPVVILATGIHVSTAEAYRALNRTLTQDPRSPTLKEFQAITFELAGKAPAELPLRNDFEEPVFASHAALAGWLRKLKKLGAQPARMTGSGSALFGVFERPAAAQAAAERFGKDMAFAVQFLSRKAYVRAWRRALAEAAPFSVFSQRLEGDHVRA